MHNVFYEPAGNGSFLATGATTGPWSAQAQHGGPPAALAARAIERHEPDLGQRLGRVSIDILRPIPPGKVTLTTRMVRPGRRVALVEAVMECDGQEVLYARGWRLARAPDDVPMIGPGRLAHGPRSAVPVPQASAPSPPPILPDNQIRQFPAFAGMHTDGYLAAIEWRAASGEPAGGHGRAWARPKIPLLPGEELTPMCRALLVADSGNGLAAALDPQRFLFINVDLTLVLPRDPAWEWLLLCAAAEICPGASGLVETTVSDQAGECGRAMQTLLIAPL